MKNYEYRRAIVDVCHMLDADGYVGTYEGNISYRNDNKVFITPTQTSKKLMTEGQLIEIDLDGKVLAGDGKPTSETPMHTKCYKLRDDIGAVVHCHSPYATAWAQTGKDIDIKTSTEFLMFFGKVPCLKYGTPGTEEIINGLEEYIYDYDVVLLGNHGILAVGKDPMQAYSRIVSVEMVLKTELIRRQLFPGLNCDLPQEECDKLVAGGVKSRGYHGK